MSREELLKNVFVHGWARSLVSVDPDDFDDASLGETFMDAQDAFTSLLTALGVSDNDEILEKPEDEDAGEYGEYSYEDDFQDGYNLFDGGVED